jgi:hypothetical protein
MGLTIHHIPKTEGTVTEISIEQRIAKLENHNRRLRRAMLLLGALLCFSLINGFYLKPYTFRTRSIYAREVVLEDEKGRMVGLFGSQPPRLCFFDDRATIRTQLGYSEGHPWVGLFDEQGDYRAGLALHQYGPGLDFLGQHGRRQLSLYSSDSLPGITFFNAKGDVPFGIGINNAGKPHLSLLNDQGKPYWRAVTP